jgi:hypothetical protein
MRGVALFFLILFLAPEKYLYMVSFAKSPLKPRFARTCAKYSVKVNFVIGRGFSPFGVAANSPKVVNSGAFE